MQSWSLVSLHPRHVAPNADSRDAPGCPAFHDRAACGAPGMFSPLPIALGAEIKTQELFGPAQRGLVNSSFMGGHLDKQPLYLIICPHC